MTDNLDKNMPNRLRVEHILGIDDKNQQGNLSKSQGAALQAWTDLQNLLSDAVWGKGEKVGGQSYVDALMALLNKWTGPAADEFKKQAGKISTFGALVANKIDGEIDTKVDSSTSTWNYSVSNIQAHTSTSAGTYHDIVTDFSNFATAVGSAVSDMLGREMKGGQKDQTGRVPWKNGFSYAITWKTKRWVWLCPDRITAVTVESWGPGGGYSSSEIHDDNRIHDYDTSYADHVLAHHGPTFDPQFATLHDQMSKFYNQTATEFPMGLDTSALPAPDLSGHPQSPDGPGSPSGPGANPGGSPHLPGGTKLNPTGTHPNPTGTHPNGTYPNPNGTHPNPTGTHPNPTGTHPNPTGTYPNPTGTHQNPTGGIQHNPTGSINNGGGTYHLPSDTTIPTTSLPGPGGIGIPPYQTTTAGYTPNNSPLPTPSGLVGDPSLGGFQGGPGPLGGTIGNPSGGFGGGFNPAGGLGGGLGGNVGGSGEVSNPAFAAQGVSAEAAAARQAALAGQTAAGEAGMAGRMPMMPPMAPMGMNGDKSDRARRSWIPEDADLWGTDDVTTTPPVIGA